MARQVQDQVRPKFSVIATDYEKHVNRNNMVKGLRSLADQGFKDFELVIVHDGPKEVPYEQEVDFEVMGLNPVILNTPERMNNWGHSSRDLGMRNASGQYYIQFNIDNRFVPYAFGVISDKLDAVEEDIVIFQVNHWKAAGGHPFRGIPPKHCFIDCMQLVASAEIWKEIGYWYRTEGTSDGLIYEDMCNRYPWSELPMLLGENF